MFKYTIIELGNACSILLFRFQSYIYMCDIFSSLFFYSIHALNFNENDLSDDGASFIGDLLLSFVILKIVLSTKKKKKFWIVTFSFSFVSEEWIPTLEAMLIFFFGIPSFGCWCFFPVLWIENSCITTLGLANNRIRKRGAAAVRVCVIVAIFIRIRISLLFLPVSSSFFSFLFCFLFMFIAASESSRRRMSNTNGIRSWQ